MNARSKFIELDAAQVSERQSIAGRDSSGRSLVRELSALNPSIILSFVAAATPRLDLELLPSA
jgi:hypothetical protein